jgi:transaldolase
MLALAEDPLISGFTTNPTLMRRSGVTDYTTFAKEVLAVVTELPISFEVVADEFDEMRRQAILIASWGANVYVKIPVTNTRGESSTELIRELSLEGLKLNVTAILSLRQVWTVAQALAESHGAVVSIFAGRVADTGRDPIPLMIAALDILTDVPQAELLWASPREILNVVQADGIGCHIVTVTHDLLKKLGGLGRDLEDVSRDTVVMFNNDAQQSGLIL